jgi:hypothetical protein
VAGEKSLDKIVSILDMTAEQVQKQILENFEYREK